MKVLITCSGIGSRMGEYTKFTNKTLIKIGDKFTIDYIIDLFINLKNVEFIITLGYYGDFVKQYLEISYPKLNFTYIHIDIYEGYGSSLGYTILKTKKYLQEPFIYIACDTIILDKLFIDKNFVINSNLLYVYDYKDSTNYASVNCNNEDIVKINNKKEKIFDYIYVGLSQILDYKIFWEELENIFRIDNYELGDVDIYKKMLKKKKFKCKILKEYYDSGSITIFKKKINLNNHYNVLTKYEESISFHKNKVVKFFYNSSKNFNRIKRSEHIKEIIPNIYNHSKNFFVMEKINSKPISEIYTDNLIYKLLVWGKKNLWKKKNTPINFKETIYNFYYKKTMDRINKSISNNIIDFNIINNLEIGNIFDLIKKINFDKLCNAEAYNFHGDFILDNILINNKNEFVLIDWREDFGGDLENGDIYYDFSKLKHNIFLNHKNLENNLFTIQKINENECIVDLKCNYYLINQIKQFEKFMNDNDFNNKKINILMSLIWINMAPLHEYPLSNFLFNFGKYNLYLNIQSF